MCLRTVAADRLALALAQPQPIDDRGPEHEDEDKRGDHRAAGAERDVAEHVEEPETCPKCGLRDSSMQLNVPASADLRLAPLARRFASRSQRLDDGRHPGAERAFDHDGSRRLHRTEQRAVELLRSLRIAAPAARREEPPRARCIIGPQQKDEIDARRSSTGSARPRAARRLAVRVRACRRAPRCGARAADSRLPEQRDRRAHRGRIGVVALVDQRSAATPSNRA